FQDLPGRAATPAGGSDWGLPAGIKNRGERAPEFLDSAPSLFARSPAAPYSVRSAYGGGRGEGEGEEAATRRHGPAQRPARPRPDPLGRRGPPSRRLDRSRLRTQAGARPRPRRQSPRAARPDQTRRVDAGPAAGPQAHAFRPHALRG